MSKSKHTILGMILGLIGGFLGGIFLVPVESRIFLGADFKSIGGIEGVVYFPGLMFLFILTWAVIFIASTLIGLYLDKARLIKGAK